MNERPCRLPSSTTRFERPRAGRAGVESFNGRVRDELLNIEEFATLLEAQVVVEAWRVEYNTYRPHGALYGLTPAEYRVRWNGEHQPALS